LEFSPQSDYLPENPAMTSPYLTFRKFNNEAQLEELTDLLNRNNILYEIEQFLPSYDAVLGFVSKKEFIVKVHPENFTFVEKLLGKQATEIITEIDSNHYLFDFTDDELFDLLLRADEWSPIDVELAKKILKDRGKEISSDILELMQKRRLTELAEPEPSLKTWIYAGYFFAFCGGLFGFFIGLHLLTHKKTLPDGTRVYAHNKSDRKHGIIIFITGIIVFIILYVGRAIRATMYGTAF
jgi:hypothetical protein